MILTALVLTGSALYVTVRAILKPLLTDEPAVEQKQPGSAEEQAPVQGEQPPEPAVPEDINHLLATSVAGTGLAAAGVLLASTPLLLISGGVTFYTCLPNFERAYRAIFIEKRIHASILDSVAVTAILASGFLFFGALSNTFYYIGRKLLGKTEDESRKRLTDLFGAPPRTVWISRDGVEVEIPLAALQSEDIVVVIAGQVVPVDGIVRDGLASVDQRLLTGESRPVDKREGDPVYATTMVISGRLFIKVERTGTATVVAQLGEALKRTAAYRATVEARAEKLANRAVVPTLGVSAVALAQVGTHGAVAVLSSNYVDTIRTSMPLGVLNFLNRAAEHHILIRDGRVLEVLKQIDTVVFNKTGTLTTNEPCVEHIHTCHDEVDADTLLRYAAAAESTQRHPLSSAICKAAAQRSLPLLESEQSTYFAGYGLLAEIEAQPVRVGSGRYMANEGIDIPQTLRDRQTEAHAKGHSSVYVSIGDKLAGMLEIRPTVRDEAQPIIDALRARGLSITILSGDYAGPTEHLADTLNINSYFAEVQPETKADLVEKLQQRGRKVLFVGDGISDSMALQQADVSISMCGATTLATDTAQVVLLDSTLRQLPALFELADEFNRYMRNSLLTMIVPSATLVGGVFLFNLGLYASLLFVNVSLLAGVANAMQPLLKREQRTDAI